jgi:hypothetical protein
VRLSITLAPALFCAVAFAACGGASDADLGGDAGADGQPIGDAANETTYRDGGCVNPVEGAACSPGDTACGPTGNVCCIGYVWLCDSSSHRWVREGVGCACNPTPDASASDAHVIGDGGPWACGTGSTVTKCTATQYCQDHPPGIAPPDGGSWPDGYDCWTVPPHCASNPTCACIMPTLTNSACTATSCTESDGHVEVHCLGV